MNDPNLPSIPGPSAPQYGPAPTGGSPGGDQNPLLLIHNLLRGRYIIAGVLGCVLGLAGAVGGYMAKPLNYESHALIRVAPVLPKILYESEENSALPMFDAFVQTQVSLMTSRRVVEMAIQSPTWKDVGGTYSLEAIGKFNQNLRVSHPRNSQLIEVAYTDVAPRRAQAAVKSLVNAYMSIYGESDLVTDTQRLQVLEERERSLSNEIEGLRAQILEIASEFGSSALEEMHAFELEKLQNIESELEAAKLELANVESRAAGRSDDDGATDAELAALTIEQIASIDGRMQALVDERKALQWKVDEFDTIYKAPEQYPEYRVAVKQLESHESEIEEYAEQFRENYSMDTGTVTLGTASLGATEADVERAKMKVERFQGLYDEVKAQTLNLGRKNLQIEKLRTDMARAQERLDKTQTRIEQLSIESSVGGRVSLLSEAEVPASPSNERKRLQFAVLGGLGGGGLGVGLIVLLGLVNPRVRDVRDAERVRPSILGALPELPSNLSDPAEAVIASQCVHHIRTMLQARTHKQQPLALAVTSAASGTGKTSLTLSLGLSFASAGTRTLLVDGDLSGMGVSRRTGAVARRKLGQVFRDYEVISERELKHAIDHADESGSLIGESLQSLGYISESDLEEGLTIQRDVKLGLADALNGERVEDCVAEIQATGLHVLPGGEGAQELSNGFSPTAVNSLIERLKGSYDLILIDTGPIPGATDSSVLASCADGVVMVVSRGETQLSIQRAIQHLQRLHASVVGVVMNRATSRDLARSGQSSPGYSGSKPADGAIQVERRTALSDRLEAYAGFGPLAQAVMSVTTENPERVGFRNKN